MPSSFCRRHRIAIWKTALKRPGRCWISHFLKRQSSGSGAAIISWDWYFQCASLSHTVPARTVVTLWRQGASSFSFLCAVGGPESYLRAPPSRRNKKASPAPGRPRPLGARPSSMTARTKRRRVFHLWSSFPQKGPPSVDGFFIFWVVDTSRE